MEELQEYNYYAVAEGPISLEEVKTLYGANYFSGGPVVRFRINLGDYDEVFSNAIPNFFEQLKTLIPTLYNHHCSVGREGGFFERMKEGTLLGHVMEHTAIELQNLAGMDVGFGKTRGAKKKGVYNVVFRYFDEIAGIYAGKAALNLINSIILGKGFNVDEIIENLIVIREKRLLGPSTQAIVDEAERRKIPVIRLDKYNLVQLGTGKFRKNIRATITDETSLLAVETSDDKYLTNNILSESGIPTPKQIITDKLEDVHNFHSLIQSSIVVKPAQGYQGKRVSIDLNAPETIENAFGWAKEFHNEIIAQEDIPGGTYRLLVINYQLVAAVRLIPANITGNGIDTIVALIEQVNAHPNREYGDKGKLSKVEVDEDTLKIIELRGYNLQSILPEGELIFLKNSGNMRLGSTSHDVTAKVHPFNKFIAQRAAKLLNLNVAGIDIISKDISVPLTDNNGVVIEVNAAPDFRVHFNPTIGTKRYVQQEFVSMLFPQNAPSSIPVYSVTGSMGKSIAVGIIDLCLRQRGLKTALVSKRGLYIDGNCLDNADATDSANVTMVLKDPTIDCAVVETTVEAILTSGLGYEYAHFGIVLNLHDLKEEYYTYDHIRDIDDIAYAKFVIAEQLYETGYAILNADTKLIIEKKSRVLSKLALFSQNASNPAFTKHINNNGTGVLLKDGNITIFDKGLEMIVMGIDEVGILKETAEEYKVEAILASTVALYLSEVPIEEIRKSLVEFTL
jgi:cyanophycin synthetase